MVPGALLLVIGCVFVAGFVHKANLLLSGEATAHPVLSASPLLGRHPRVSIAVACVTELAGSTLLVLVPAAGAGLLLSLLSLYTLAVAKLAPTQDCECFGSLAPTATRGQALRRNALLAVLLVSALAALAEHVEPILNAQAAALALLLAAPFAGIATQRRLTEPRRGGHAPHV
jgi:hypothetical protein